MKKLLAMAFLLAASVVGATCYPVRVPDGGTGACTWTAHSILFGEGNAAFNAITLPANAPLLGTSSADPHASTAFTMTDSTAIFADTGTNPEFDWINGASNKASDIYFQTSDKFQRAAQVIKKGGGFSMQTNDSNQTVTSFAARTTTQGISTVVTTGSSSMCASVWFHLDHAAESNRQYIAYLQMLSGASARGFDLHIHTNGILGADFQASATSVNNNWFTGMSAYADNSSHHAVITWDGSSVTVWSDKVLATPALGTATGSFGGNNAGSGWWMGNSPNQAIIGQLSGRVDEFQMYYSHTCTQSDVQQLYDHPTSTLSSGTLVLHYTFDESSGATTWADTSGNTQGTLLAFGSANPSAGANPVFPYTYSGTTGSVVTLPILTAQDGVHANDTLIDIGDTADSIGGTATVHGDTFRFSQLGTFRFATDLNGAWASAFYVGGTTSYGVNAGMPSWTSGSGAPSANCNVGSIYSRTDGALGSALYRCTATPNTWAALTNTLLDGTMHSDTASTTVTRGMIPCGNSTPAWAGLSAGSSGAVAYWNASGDCATGAIDSSGVTAGTTDITTGNATGAKHGLLKKLSSAVLDYMGGDGNWNTLTAGSNVTITNSGGATTISSTGGGSTTSIQGNGGPVYSQTNTVTVASSNTETTLVGSGTGSATLVANYFNPAGSILEGYVSGVIGDTALSPTLQPKVYLGATAIIDFTALTMPTITGSEGWHLKFKITSRTTGATGTVFGNGEFCFDTGALAGQCQYSANTGTSTVDTTGTLAASVKVTWSASSSSNTISASQLDLTRGANTGNNISNTAQGSEPSSPSTGDADVYNDGNGLGYYNGSAWTRYLTPGNAISLQDAGQTSSTSYMTVASNTALDASTAISISVWIMPVATNSSAGGLGWKGTGSSGSGACGEFQLIFGSGASNTGFAIHDSGSDCTWSSNALTNLIPFLGQWHHLVGTWDKNGDGKARFYLDGVLQATGSAYTTALTTNTNPFTIGTWYNKAAARNFEGYVQDIRLWKNYALTSTEIATLYNKGRGYPKSVGSTPESGWWKCSEGTGTTCADSSGNGNTMSSAGTLAPTWVLGRVPDH